jgi:hypothetical protein
MSRFYANIKGSRGEATRQGTPKSGIYAHIRGWNAGVSVRGYVDECGKDRFLVCATGGSNGGSRSQVIGTVEETEEGFLFILGKEFHDKSGSHSTV